jgi:deoxyribose-phosphate aldolase
VATKKLTKTKTIAAKRTNGHANGEAHSRMREGSQEAALVLPTGGTRGPRGYRPPHVPPVEAVGLEERAASLAKRSIKKQSKVQGLELAIAMMDLTTLEGKDTPGKVVAMCRKAVRPSDRHDVPSCAAVCVYPNLVPIAKRALEGSTVKVASVATAFPSGQSPLPVKLDDVRRAVGFGADEIDMVIDRGAFLRGDYGKVFDEIAQTKEACGAAHLKVILETGELGTYDAVRLASDIAIEAGGDFIKTSTGKVQPAATLPVTLLMLETIRDHVDRGGRLIGMKPAGGVRTAKQALQYLCVVNETLGEQWLDPDLFRFGASALLNDVLMQLEFQRTGSYAGEDYFSKD